MTHHFGLHRLSLSFVFQLPLRFGWLLPPPFLLPSVLNCPPTPPPQHTRVIHHLPRTHGRNAHDWGDPGYERSGAPELVVSTGRCLCKCKATRRRFAFPARTLMCVRACGRIQLRSMATRQRPTRCTKRPFTPSPPLPARHTVWLCRQTDARFGTRGETRARWTRRPTTFRSGGWWAGAEPAHRLCGAHHQHAHINQRHFASRTVVS